MSNIPLTKRSIMTLFSDPRSPNSHRVRLVAKEKDIPMDVVEVDPEDLPEDLLELNPYGSLPTLVDRELVLYDAQVIIEYLDERYPHPPLLAVDPITKARSRQQLRQIETEWYPLVETIVLNESKESVRRARRDLTERLVQMIPVFAHKPFFMSDDYTLVDASLAVLLWRLPSLGVELPKSAKAITDYSNRLMEREMFNESLSEDELDMNEA